MKKIFIRGFFVIIAASVGTGLFFHFRPLADGLDIEGEIHTISTQALNFFSDKTYAGADGQRISEQKIFDEILKIISESENYILVDMFLFNDFNGKETTIRRKLSEELSNALINKKKEKPTISITLITDPINRAYTGPEPEYFKKMKNAGIEMIITDLNKIKDGNFIYSSFWRLFSFLPWPKKLDKVWLPNPFDSQKPKVPISAYLYLPNFKANHRKIILADKKGEIISSFITSANPHDASSYHSNTAIKIDGGIWRDVIGGEKAVALFSGRILPKLPDKGWEEIVPGKETAEVQFLTEGKIKKKILEILNKTKKGDSIDMAMFYLSDREVIKSLIKSSLTGVEIRLLLDPNKDAFGFEKNGVPNRSVAAELIKKSKGKIKIKWCDTRGEQCHSKMILVKMGENYFMLLGSANLTKRNIGGYNLEADVLIKSETKIPAISEAYDFISEIWNNKNEKIYSVDYKKYKDESLKSYLIYLFKEISGMSSF